MRSWFAVVSVLLFCGCSVDAEALRAQPDSRAPVRGPGILDAGTPDVRPAFEPDMRPSSPDSLPSFPDAVPSVDSVAAEAPRAASDSLSDAGLADGLPSSLDTSPASDLRPAPDVLPASDLISECPRVSWSAIADQWRYLVDVPATPACFALCGKQLNFLMVTPSPGRSIKINGVASVSTFNEQTGYLPAVQPVDGFYVFRISAGDPVTISVVGQPGACS